MGTLRGAQQTHGRTWETWLNKKTSSSSRTRESSHHGSWREALMSSYVDLCVQDGFSKSQLSRPNGRFGPVRPSIATPIH